MRFGKTLSVLELVRRVGFSKTIIVTHRPVVDVGWYEYFKKIFHNEPNYLYGSRNSGYKQIDKLMASKKKFVYFASMQDLRGSQKIGGKYFKNVAVFNTDWDLVIVDEAHEGTTTALGDYEENIFTWDYIME